MRIHTVLAVAAVWLSIVTPAWAQFKQGDPGGAKAGKSQTSEWRVGMTITASGGVCRGGNGYMSVPMDWPEQQVTVVKEEVSPEIRIRYTTIEGGVKIMNFRIGQIPAGQEAKAIVTFEIRRSAILPPDDTDIYVLPDPKKAPREIRMYLVPSPKIESRDPKIRELAKTIGEDKEKAWDKVEAIYDWVRSKVKYKVKSGKARSALIVLKDGNGDCEEFSSLFVAICRAADIPARIVWVPSHVYPEFYLLDDKGQGHWFPCQSAGSREFGGITDMRPIWQKGDNIRPPINPKKHEAYLDFDLSVSGSGAPVVKSFRTPVGSAKPQELKAGGDER
jgi:hypothetical protein